LAKWSDTSYCLAYRILASTCAKTEVQSTPGGVVKVLTTLYDSNGDLATGLSVRFRIVPGAFEWHSLNEKEPGIYEATLEPSGLPSFYDPAKQKYTQVMGRVRLVLSIRGNGTAGGNMLVHEL
jgi:hypothetical protein